MKKITIFYLYLIFFSTGIFAQTKDSVEAITTRPKTEQSGENIVIDKAGAIPFLNKAKELIENKKYMDAFKELNQCIKLDFENIEARKLRAGLNRKFGNENAVFADLRKIKEIENKDKYKVLELIDSLGIRITENSHNTEFIFEAPNKNKSDLFLKANEWTISNKEASKVTIQALDKDAGLIVANGIFYVSPSEYSFSEPYEIGFTVSIRVKDFKVKVNIDNLIFRRGNDISVEDIFLKGKHSLISKKEMPYFSKELKYKVSAICLSIRDKLVKNIEIEDNW